MRLRAKRQFDRVTVRKVALESLASMQFPAARSRFDSSKVNELWRSSVMAEIAESWKVALVSVAMAPSRRWSPRSPPWKETVLPLMELPALRPKIAVCAAVIETSFNCAEAPSVTSMPLMVSRLKITEVRIA